MKQYHAEDIRNVALVGHSGSGKTSLAEAAYFLTGKADRLGKIADGNTVCDYDPEEIRRKTSVSTALLPVEWNNTKINLMDTPGLFDFAGGLREGIRPAGNAVVVISGKSGLSVGAEKGYAAAKKRGAPALFFINKLDREGSDFFKVYNQLKEKYGTSVCPVVVPYMQDHKVVCYVNLIENKAYTYKDGKATETAVPAMPELDDLKVAIQEAVAETSEELMEKYFAGEPFSQDEIITGMATGVHEGSVAPVFCGSGQDLSGIDQLLNGLVWLGRRASVTKETATDKDGKEIVLTTDENGPAVAIIFKTVVDRFVGKLQYFKVVSGKITADSTVINMTTGAQEKIGKVMFVRGEKQEDTPCIVAGDIGAVAKLNSTKTGDTLCAAPAAITLKGIEFDKPCLSMAVYAKNKGDEEKIAQGLSRLMEEDPSITYETNVETKEAILSGLGEQHLDVITSKLKSKFGVDVELQAPRVPYRETIRKKVKVQGRHKKQSGGHGQFGDVWIEFEPCDSDGLVFEEAVFGGSVPKNFFPAVEKGLQDSAKSGMLAGFPMVGVKATLVDGSYHPVDSSEMAFKTAAHLAYKAGILQASPVLLEPIGVLKTYVPQDYTGDIMSDVTKRRGRVLGMNPDEDGLTCVEAEVPMAETSDFATALRSMTQGRGYFTLEFARYEQAPEAVTQKVMEQYKVEDDE